MTVNKKLNEILKFIVNQPDQIISSYLMMRKEVFDNSITEKEAQELFRKLLVSGTVRVMGHQYLAYQTGTKLFLDGGGFGGEGLLEDDIPKHQDQRIINQTIIQQMNNVINNNGDGNVITTGSHNRIDNELVLYKGNIVRLQAELRKQGLEDADIQELKEIVNTEQPNAETGHLGEKSKSWIMKIVGKSLSGIGKIATGVSSNLLAALIREFYGLP